MEWLKELLGDTLYNQVISITEAKGIKIGNIGDGSYIPKDKFDTKLTEIKSLKDTITELQKNSSDISKSLEDKLSKKHKEEIDLMMNQFNEKITMKDKEIIKNNKKQILLSEFTSNKAIYPELLLNTVDLEKYEIENDKLKGFSIDDHMTKYPGMFEVKKQSGNVIPKGTSNPLPETGAKAKLITQYNEIYNNEKIDPTNKVIQLANLNRQILSIKE